MKGTLDIRRVSTPARQRQVASRKRTLRRRSVRTARSVWSRPQSSAVEFRNSIAEVFLLDPGGTALRRAILTGRGEARPESECVAEGRVDVPGTWESLCLPVYRTTGTGRSRNTTFRVVIGIPAEASIEASGTGRVRIGESETNRFGCTRLFHA